jgi:hypothetical protein
VEFEIRLGILKDAGQIDEEIYRNVIKIISIFHNRWCIELNEENGAMLITHLCRPIMPEYIEGRMSIFKDCS